MPNQTVSLTPDEQDRLMQHCAQASPATLIARPPIVADSILHQMSPQDVSIPSTSLGLSLASTPSDALHQSLPFGTQIPLGRPSFSTPSPLVPSTLPAERLAQRRTIKRRRSLLESGNEGSGAENCYGGAVLETPIDQVGLLLDNLTKRHEGFTRPQSNFIGSEDSGARFRELAHLFAERDAFASELLSLMKMMASQMKEWQARDGEGDGEEDVQAFSNVRTGTLSRKKMKVERTPFEQKVNNLVKVRTHAVLRHVLDFRPSGKETVPSIGDLRKNEDGTMSEELLDVPDWSQGVMSRANERWMAMIKKKTCKDIEGSQELRSALNDGQQKEIVFQAITSSVTTYFEHLRRRWKDQNDVERLERREAVSRQNKRDQRVRLLHKRLTKEATLEQVNIWIEKAAIRLDLPRVEIIEDDIPQDALSDLESDAEDVNHQEKMRYAKEAGLEKVSSKWMSRRKVWTSGEFEALKDLAKVVVNSREVRWAAAAPKKAPATSQYRGPPTLRRPKSMKNVQDWMVDPIMLLDDLATCQKNREPPFTPTTIQTLKLLLETALEICSKGGGDNSEPETQ